MDLTKSILKDVRDSLGLGTDDTSFDAELLMHINSAISTLNQNGIGNVLVVIDDKATWGHLQNPEQTDGNVYFQWVPLYIHLSTKLLFDPPPPSNVQYHSSSIEQLLWRLKVAYEEPYVPTTDTTTF